MSTLPCDSYDRRAYDRWLTTDPREAEYDCDGPSCCDDCHGGFGDCEPIVRRGLGRTNGRRTYHVCADCDAAATLEGEEMSGIPVRSVIFGGPGREPDLSADPDYAAVCDTHRDGWIECIDAECAADETPGEWRNAVVCTG